MAVKQHHGRAQRSGIRYQQHQVIPGYSSPAAPFIFFPLTTSSLGGPRTLECHARVHVKAVLPFCGRCTNLSSCLVISISSRFIRLVRPSLHRDVTAPPPAQNKLPATTSSSSLHSRLVCSIIPFTTFHDSGKNLPSHYHFSRPSAFSLSLENGSISAQPVWQ